MKTNFVSLLTRRSVNHRSNQAGQGKRRARTPNGRLLVCLGLVLLAAVLLGHIGGFSTSAGKGTGQRGAAGPELPSTASQKQGTNSVAAVLNEDGSIQPGANGSFDVSGFSMAYGPNGAPRFVPQVSCGTPDWDGQFGFNGPNDVVFALAVSGNTIFVGGNFTVAGNVAANHVAKFDTTTNTWSALSQATVAGNINGVNKDVDALAVIGNSLFVGGAFTTAGTNVIVFANGLAKFDLSTNTWSALKQGNGNGVSGFVGAMAVSGNSLFVGGGFTDVNKGGTGATPAITANNLAKFDISTNTWSLLSQGNGNGVDFQVEALLLSGNSLFVGGAFTSANKGGTAATPAITANGVAKFDTSTNTWSALKQGDGNGLNAGVAAMALIGNTLFVGGTFTAANSGGTGATPAITARRVAKFDTVTNTWSALSQGNGNGVSDFSTPGASTNGAVFALAVSGNTVFVGGFFNQVNQGGTGATPAITANGVAKFDTTTNTWSALSQGNGAGSDGGLFVLAVSGTSVFPGGGFDFVNQGGTGGTPAIPASNLARFDTSTNTWSALASSGTGNGVNDTVKALVVSGNNLFVGGDFTVVGYINPVTANRVAKFDTTTNTWSALSQGNGNGVNTTVRALAVIGSSLFAGGDFTTANLGGTGATPSIPANRMARFDTTTNTWSALSQGNGNGVSSVVEALAVMGNSLFVGGRFGSANSGGTGGTPAIIANSVAKFDAATNTWSALSQGNGNGVSNIVHALAVSGNSLFVGGDYGTANQGGTGATPEITAIRVAKFDAVTNTWIALSQGNGNGVNNVVWALAANGSSLFVGGEFTTVNSGGTGATPAITANRVAKFDTSTSTWSTLSQGNGNGVNSTVLALAVSDTSVFAGGAFITANQGGTGATPPINAHNVAKFDTIANAWSALAGSGGGNGVNQTPSGANSLVYTLAVKDCDLFVGGNFLVADNKASLNIARYAAPSVAPSPTPTPTPTPSLSINDVSVAEGNSGTINAVFAVTLSAPSSQTVTVNFATANGTATQPSDYQSTTGTLTFNPGETSKNITVPVVGDITNEPNETFFVNLTNAVNATISDNQGVGNILNDDTPVFNFSLANYTVSESGGSVLVTVNRSGDPSPPVAVNYTTSDNSDLILDEAQAVALCAAVNSVALSKCDFNTTLGTLRFASGETTKSFTILLTNDSYVEGTERAPLTLSNPTNGAVLGSQSNAMLEIIDDTTEPSTNAIDDARNFVRQNYHDFLNREPDGPGWDFWTDNITKCNDPARRPPNQTVAQCLDKQRETTSGAFFLSPEFQYTGSYVYRLFKGSLGRAPTFLEFTRDTQQVGAGIIVNNALSGAVINQNKTTLAQEFVQRTEFLGIYSGLNNLQYVDKLFLTTGINASAADRSALVTGLNNSSESRATVLHKVVDGVNIISESNQQFTTTYGKAYYDQEFNNAFVQMEYFGYLKRIPDGPGYNFWLGKLLFYGDFITAEMVKSFIAAPEFRARFGKP